MAVSKRFRRGAAVLAVLIAVTAGAAVSDYSTTPASNNSAPPNGAPEGMAPSAVNDTIRQIMADIRSFYDEACLDDGTNCPASINITGKTGTAKTLSTSAPSGGSDGDIWYRY